MPSASAWTHLRLRSPPLMATVLAHLQTVRPKGCSAFCSGWVWAESLHSQCCCTLGNASLFCPLCCAPSCGLPGLPLQESDLCLRTKAGLLFASAPSVGYPRPSLVSSHKATAAAC